MAPLTGALRLPSAFRFARSLRARLAVLYGAFLCALVAAVLAVAVWLAPNFFIHHAAQASPLRQTRTPGCSFVPSRSRPCILGTTHQLPIAGVTALVILIVVALACGWLIAGRMLRPLRAITTTARDISSSNLNRRLDLAGSDDEFAELGQTLDDLFERLEASFESQRHFVANASHELRTPLAAERTLLQVALADPDATAPALRSACEQVLRLGAAQERLIDALLTLATSERGLDRWEPFDLAEVAAKAIDDRRDQARQLGLRVEADLSAAPALGDPSLARSLVANLVDNAIRYNSESGWLTLTTDVTAGGQATFSIANSGPVIPPADVDRLFQPFQRFGAQRPAPGEGNGLGLAIAGAIAGAHGAVLTATARAEGGLEVRVRFPDPSQRRTGAATARSQA
jgi:signal transduction histidine kinase